MQDRLLFSVAETCRILNMSRSKLYLEMDAGRLLWVKNGSRRFIQRDELERYVGALKAVA